MGREIEIVNLPSALAFPARALSFGWGSHVLLDLSKIRAQLGYRDVVPAVDALARTVRWYLEHRPEPGGEIERRLGDPFDYEVEDALIARFAEVTAELASFGARRTGVAHHPYPHPTEAGLARDHRDR
jgi:hypothetical protein